jgi:lysozyme
MTDAYLHCADRKLVLQVRSDLARHEGYREFAYADPLTSLYKKYAKLKKWGYEPARNFVSPKDDLSKGNPWTVGYGFTNGVNIDTKMDRTKADRMLEQLILEEDGKLRRALPWYADASFVTKTVLINMAFNLGLKGLLGFRNTLAFIKAKEFKRAATNMKLSKWHAQVGDRAVELEERMAEQTIAAVHKAAERI